MKHDPNTKRRLDKMEPSMEACTTVTWFCLKAMTETITSTALPNVAFNKPAIESLWMDSPSSSVAKASNEANGIMAMKFVVKMATALMPSFSATIPSGTKSSNQLTGDDLSVVCVAS